MSLGYCILHANQIDVALTGMREDATAADEGVDMGLGALALHQPDQLITGYLDGVLRQIQALLQRVEQAFRAEGGAFAELRRVISGLGQARFDELRLTPWVDRAADLIAALEPVALAGKLDAMLERIAVALPELGGGGLLDGVLDVALGGLDALERPRLGGSDDIPAHRAFRMARIVRYWLGDALAGLRERLAQFDLVAALRAALRELTGGLSAPDAGVLRDLSEKVRGKLRPFAVALDALLAVRVSVRVDAGVQPLPDPGQLWLDDNLATPHDYRHPLWWLDLSGGIGAFAFSVVDVQRFGPFYAPRAGDAILCVLNLAWQTVRTIVRAVRPEFLRKNHSTTPGAFWFSELGDFCVQLFLNLLGSMHEAAHAGSNWVMSFACRLGRWFTFTLQPRLPYLFARSVWYLRAWREQGWVTEHVVAAGQTIESIAAEKNLDPERLRVWNRIAAGNQPEAGDKLVIPADPPGDGAGRSKARLSFVRHTWSAWFWIWLVGAINGICQGWDDMQLDKLGETRFVKVGLWLGPVVGLLAAIFLPWAIAEGFAGVEYEIDWASFTALVGMMLLMIGVIAGSMYSTNATRGVWWVMLIVAALVLGLLFIPVLVIWLKDNPDLKTAGGFLYTWSLLIGAIVFGLLTTILWWMAIDDGRDKEGKFTGLRAATSPYKLPWPKDDVWICGQGFHGIFSHFLRDNAFNHYGYDFLEAKDKPALAARGGLVATIRQSNPYGSPNQNDIAILHLDWSEGHDPGTEFERVQTASHYIHIGPRRARIDIDQYVAQGQNVVDIDSTGMSAQQHLHFGASQVPSTRWDQRAPVGRSTKIRYIWSRELSFLTPGKYFIEGSRPVIFADPSLQRDRTNPILRWIPGHIHHPGRPLAQCLYKSDNTRVPGSARPIVLVTLSASPDRAGSAHTHRLEIDAAKLPFNGTLTGDPIEVSTTVDAGHRHLVRLRAADVEALLRHDLPADWKTERALEGALAHEHTFEPETWAGSVVPPPVGGVTQPSRLDSPIAQVGLTAPPTAQLLARKPGPYDLLGHRLILRVDGRATEFYSFAGDRAALLGDLPVDRAPRPGDTLSLTASAAFTPAVAGARAGLRAGLAELDTQASRRDALLRAVPVLVLETRERGTDASLEVDIAAGAGPAFADPGAVSPLSARGSGALPHRSLTRAELGALIVAACNLAPARTPPDPAQVQAGPTPGAGATDLAVAATAVTVTAGSSRVRRIFTARYDTPNRRLLGEGPLAFGPGRFTLEWGVAGSALEVPIAGTPAVLDLDPAAAGLAADPHLTTLFVTLGTTEVALRLPTGIALPDLAALLMREVDGLRAFVLAGKLRLESVDVGPGVSLAVRKRVGAADFTASARGEAPGLGAAAAIDDSALVTRDELVRAVTDAARRAKDASDRAAAIAAHTQPEVKVAWTEGRLKIFVDAPATLELLAANSGQALLRAISHESIAEGAPPNLLRTDSNRALLSRPLPDALDLPLGWLDLKIGADTRRVHLDAEPARIDLAPLRTWPEGQLDLKIGADTVHVDLAGRTSLEGIAAAIRAAAGERLLVRIAHRVAIEARHPGSVDVALADSSGGQALGFLDRNGVRASGLGPARDLHAVAATSDLSTAREDLPGALGEGLAAAVTGTSPSEKVELSATGGRLLRVIALPGTADPFGLATTVTTAPTATVTSAAINAASLPRRVVQYRLELFTAGAAAADPAVGGTHVQFSAAPAVVRATRPLGVLALALEGAARLRVRVTWPSASGPRQRDCTLDFGWASALLREQSAGLPAFEAALRRRVVDQIQRELPLVDAWLVGPGDDQLHLQTRGAGTGWLLRLEGEAAIIALGIAPERITAGVVEVRGGGDVVDERRVSATELRDAFRAAAAHITLRAGEAAYEVASDHDRLSIAAVGAPITLRVEPAALAAALGATPTGAAVVIDAQRPLDLPGGRIVVQRGSDAVAALLLHGSRASARSQGPATGPGIDEAARVAPLKALTPTQRLEVEVDGVTTSVGRFPDAVANVADALTHLARRVPAARFALVVSASGPAGSKDLVVESRRRGSSSRVALRFVGVPPALGCTADLQGAGAGSFPDLAAVTAAELRRALLAARSAPVAAAQGLVAGAATAAHHVEIRAADSTADLNDLSGVTPRSGALLRFARAPGRPDLLDLAWPAATAVLSTVLQLHWESSAQNVSGTAVTRKVLVPLWGAPARMTLPVRPALPSSFVNHRLRLKVEGQELEVRFAMPTGWDDLAAQIERQSDYRVLARIVTRGATHLLDLSTPGEGSTVTLQLRPASAAPDARDLLTLPADPAAERRGEGSLPHLDRVEDAHLAQAIAQGLATRDVQSDNGSADFVPDRAVRYVAGARATAPLLRLRSPRRGCMSHVEPLLGREPFDFDRSLARGPAVRAAVVILPGAAFDLAAEAVLVVELDDNGAGADVSPPRRIEVRFPPGHYTRQAAADQIHGALFGAGAGMAGRYLDDSIVVETLTPGLAGSVRLPATGSTETLTTALGIAAGPPLEARGWPGAGDLEDNESFRLGNALAPASVVALNTDYMPLRGLRGRKTPATTAGVAWRFHSDDPTAAGVLSTPTLTLQAWNVDDLVRELDRTLAQASGGGITRRIGHAKKGRDGTLQIEALEGRMLVLQVQPAGGALGPQGTDIRPGLGERRDVKGEPGLDLRATDTLRTYHLVYDRWAGATTTPEGRFVDAGWLRPPTDFRWGTTRDHETYEPIDVPAWPHGRYLLSARAEAAKHDYGGDAEMIASAGQATLDGEVIDFVRIARYWIGLTCMTRWNLSELWVGAGEPKNATGNPNTAGLPRAAEHHPLCAGVRRIVLPSGPELLVDWRV